MWRPAESPRSHCERAFALRAVLSKSSVRGVALRARTLAAVGSRLGEPMGPFVSLTRDAVDHGVSKHCAGPTYVSVGRGERLVHVRSARASSRWRMWFQTDRIIAKEDSAGAASARTHALTQGAKIVIRVYDIAFERFPGGVVVTTVVQSDPLSAKSVAVGEVGPGPGGCHKRPLSKERLANPSRNQIVERA